MKLPSYIRPHFAKITPYVTARDLAQEGLFLDANENPFGSVVPDVAGMALRHYPDPDARMLRVALADFLKLPLENVLATAGSNEAIDLLIRLTAGPGDAVMVAEPTFSLYHAMAGINGADVVSVYMEEEFNLTAETVLSYVKPTCKILFLCSPNNPTGNSFSREMVLEICAKFPGMVVLDEAYVEFSRYPSLSVDVPKVENLVVLRTLAKAWGLAGLRVGYAVASPVIVQLLQSIRKPYPLSTVSIQLATEGVRNGDVMRGFVEKIVAGRKWLEKELGDMGLPPFPSDANFVLVRIPRATEVYNHFKTKAGIVLRDMSSRIPDTLRITVGTPEQNQMVINELKKWVKR